MQKLLLAGLLLVLVIVVLVLETKNFSHLSSGKGSALVSPTYTTLDITSDPTEIVKTNIIPLTIMNHHIISSPSTIRIAPETEVVFQVKSDVTAPLTIDKYSTSVVLQKGKQVVLSFIANVQGSFVIRVSGIPIGTLTVLP